MDSSEHKRLLLIKLQDEMGISSIDLAKKIGISRITLSKYRNGTLKLSKQDKIKKLCKVFNVSESLFDYEVPIHNHPRKDDLPIQEKVNVIMKHHNGFLTKLFMSCVNYFYGTLYQADSDIKESQFSFPDLREVETLRKEVQLLKEVVANMQGKEHNSSPGPIINFPQAASKKKPRHPTKA